MGRPTCEIGKYVTMRSATSFCLLILHKRKRTGVGNNPFGDQVRIGASSDKIALELEEIGKD